MKISSTPDYRVWSGMLRRCDHKERYVKRGIKVCDRWRNSFAAFMEDMGPRPTPKHSIDRIDNDKGYEPSNCRWATMQEQQNNKMDNVVLTHGGESRTVAEWGRKLGVPSHVLYCRIYRGWALERVLTEPARAYRLNQRAA